MLHFHRKNHKIGLDIDDVCCKFLEGYTKATEGKFKDFNHFFFSYQTNHLLPTMPEDFWHNLEPKVDGRTLPFLPTCYISTRNFDKRISEEWLEANGFPCMPVIHTNHGSKVDACKEFGITVFVDDFIKNFEELNKAGINTLLMDCTHNRQYNVDPYRILDLHDLPSKIIDLEF
jgi:uncharacterized HAD superfamily protein